jgi:hypothetical protein
MTTVAPSLKFLREQARRCRACHLWKDATQSVFGKITTPVFRKGKLTFARTTFNCDSYDSAVTFPGVGALRG